MNCPNDIKNMSLDSFDIFSKIIFVKVKFFKTEYNLIKHIFFLMTSIQEVNLHHPVFVDSIKLSNIKMMFIERKIQIYIMSILVYVLKKKKW